MGYEIQNSFGLGKAVQRGHATATLRVIKRTKPGEYEIIRQFTYLKGNKQSMEAAMNAAENLIRLKNLENGINEQGQRS